MNKEMAIEIICGLARRSASIDGSAGKKMDVDIVPDMALNAITLRFRREERLAPILRLQFLFVPLTWKVEARRAQSSVAYNSMSDLRVEDHSRGSLSTWRCSISCTAGSLSSSSFAVTLAERVGRWMLSLSCISSVGVIGASVIAELVVERFESTIIFLFFWIQSAVLLLAATAGWVFRDIGEGALEKD
jgi:hypothetical protein